MPEIRANLSVGLHRRLKAQAAREGVHLKDLVAQILERHTNSQGGAKKRK